MIDRDGTLRRRCGRFCCPRAGAQCRLAMTLPEGKKGAKIGVQLIRLFSCTKNTHNSDYYFLFFIFPLVWVLTRTGQQSVELHCLATWSGAWKTEKAEGQRRSQPERAWNPTGRRGVSGVGRFQVGWARRWPELPRSNRVTPSPATPRQSSRSATTSDVGNPADPTLS